MRHLNRLLPCLFIALSALVPIANATEPSLNINEQSVHVQKLREADVRLSQLVRVRGRQIYLSELMHQLSEQSGVTFSVLDKGRAADTKVTVFAKTMPLADVMDRLWSLLSYKGALWYWEKQGGSGGEKPTYRLVRSLSACDFPARMEARLEAKLEQDMDEALDALSLPKDRLTALGKNNKSIETMAKDPRCYSKMAALNAALTRDQIHDLMRGQQSFTLPLSDLPQAVKDYAYSEASISPLSVGGGNKGGFDKQGVFQLPSEVKPPSQPTMIQLECQNNAGALLPTVWLMYGATTPGTKYPEPIKESEGVYSVSSPTLTEFAGGSVSGGVPQERAWCREQEDLWLLPGDKKASTQQTKKVPILKTDVDNLSVDDSLEQFSDRTGLAVFARVLPSDPYLQTEARTVERYLNYLRGGVYACKWRNDSVLVADSRWWRDELLNGAKYAPGFLREMEATRLRDPQQMLPLPAICRICQEIERGTNLHPSGDITPEWIPFLADFASKPDLLTEVQSDHGIAVKMLPPTAYRAFYNKVKEKTQFPPPSGARIRLLVEDRVEEKSVSRLLHIALVSEATVEPLADFVVGTNNTDEMKTHTP